MENIGELPITGVPKGLCAAVSAELTAAFSNGYAPARAHIMKQLKANYPRLVHPRLEYTVAQLLYRLVNSGILVRSGKFYHPAPRTIARAIAGDL